MEFSLVQPSILRVASVNVEVKRASAVSEKSSVCQMTKETGILTGNFFRARKALRAHQLWFSSLGGGLVGRWSVAVRNARRTGGSSVVLNSSTHAEIPAVRNARRTDGLMTVEGVMRRHAHNAHIPDLTAKAAPRTTKETTIKCQDCYQFSADVSMVPKTESQSLANLQSPIRQRNQGSE